MEKKISIYQSEKRVFIISADNEQRGLNATLKAINAVLSLPASVHTMNADVLTKDVFKNASNYIDFLSANLPVIFDNRGALCSVKVVEDTTENREIYAGYQFAECTINEAPALRVWIPKNRFTCNEVYNLAKKANLGRKRAEKARELAERKALNEAKKAERTAEKIAKLEKQLAELKK